MSFLLSLFIGLFIHLHSCVDMMHLVFNCSDAILFGC